MMNISMNIPSTESLQAINAVKLAEALKWLGEKHVLKTFVTKLAVPRKH